MRPTGPVSVRCWVFADLNQVLASRDLDQLMNTSALELARELTLGAPPPVWAAQLRSDDDLVPSARLDAELSAQLAQLRGFSRSVALPLRRARAALLAAAGDSYDRCSWEAFGVLARSLGFGLLVSVPLRASDSSMEDSLEIWAAPREGLLLVAESYTWRHTSDRLLAGAWLLCNWEPDPSALPDAQPELLDALAGGAQLRAPAGQPHAPADPVLVAAVRAMLPDALNPSSARVVLSPTSPVVLGSFEVRLGLSWALSWLRSNGTLLVPWVDSPGLAVLGSTREAGLLAQDYGDAFVRGERRLAELVADRSRRSASS